MSKDLPVAVAVVIVVESEGRYLMIEEQRGGDSGAVWYFPSGALQTGETLGEAASREVREETGYTVEPTGVIQIDHGVFEEEPGLFWWRFVIGARLAAGPPDPIAEPDVVDIGWRSPDELDRLRLRTPDAVELCKRAASGWVLPLEACRFAADGQLEGFFA